MVLMKKRKSGKRVYSHTEAIAWLPIDSRLFPFFSFSHVQGAARLFLITEIALSVCMVIASLLIIILHLLSYLHF